MGDKGPCGWVKCRYMCWYVIIRGYEVGPACLETWEWQRSPSKTCMHLHETAGGAGYWGNWQPRLTAGEALESGRALVCVCICGWSKQRQEALGNQLGRPRVQGQIVEGSIVSVSTCFQGFLATNNQSGTTGACVAAGATKSLGTAARETEGEPRASILCVSAHMYMFF